jgi:hypothetical protein
MVRRLTALIGAVALVLTIMPNVPSTNMSLPDCCNGVICPMRSAHQVVCDMDDSGTALKSCPAQAIHYTAAIDFVLLAPTVLYRNGGREPVISFLGNFHSNAERRVDSPPPRSLLTA